MLIQDAENGLKEFVQNVHKTGLLMLIMSVNLSQIAVKLMLDYNVIVVIMDSSLMKEFVNSHPSTLWFPLMLDVRLGIGSIKNVFNVQKDGISMLMEFVSPPMISAILSIQPTVTV